MYSILPILEDGSIRQTFSETAGNIALQNAVFRSSSTLLHYTLIWVALKNLSPSLHQFSVFHTVFRCFDFQKVIAMQNERDILNQHQKLH